MQEVGLARDGFDPGLQFVTTEGGVRGEVYTLSARRIQLGRQDATYPNQGAARISFPEPTVSGIHATLEWDDNKQRYLLTHHSKTNHSLIDGKVVIQPQFLHVGNKLKMGSLVVQLRLAPSKATVDPTMATPVAPGLGGFAASLANPDLSKGFTLLVINGPDAATLFPLTRESFVMQEPNSMLSSDPVIGIRGLQDCRAWLHQKNGEIHVASHEQGHRPILIDNPLPGVTRQRQVGPELGTNFSPDSVLLANEIAIACMANPDAPRNREMLLNGEIVNRFQPGLFHEGDRLWNRGEQHLVRCVAGPLKGMLLWIDPKRYEAPIRIGKLGRDALIELTDRGAANIEILASEDGFVVRNTDKELTAGLNQGELPPQNDHVLASGDILRIGRTALRYEYLPIQSRVDTYALVCEGKEHPLVREINTIGNSPDCDIQLDDTRLGSNFGRIVVGESSLRYLHQNPKFAAKVQGKEAQSGDEIGLRVDFLIELLPGLNLRVARRSLTYSDPNN